MFQFCECLRDSPNAPNVRMSLKYLKLIVYLVLGLSKLRSGIILL